jgi:hypothetical protein
MARTDQRVRRVLVTVAALACIAPAYAATKHKKHSAPVAQLPEMPVYTVPDPSTYGRSEHVQIMGSPSIEVTANLDMKAKHSTLYAQDFKYFVHEGDMWVSFLIDNGRVLSGSRVTLQRQILKDEQVRKKGGGMMHEPWVAMDLCVGHHRLPVTLMLADRSGYTAPLRLGRADIQTIGSVDPSLQFTAPPTCDTPPPSASSVAAPQ